jgi:hypothetical protein
MHAFVEVFNRQEIIEYAHHICKLANQIETQKDGSTIENDFFNPEIINHLLNAYMPYAFIWASFSCVNLSVSRLTNGLIENYNKYRKSGVPKMFYLIDT